MEDLRDYINKLRHDFSMQVLDESLMEKNPIKQFEKWFKEAVDAQVPEPNAMTVSTVSAEGFPSGRVALLRNFNEAGFVFYTNYASRKGKELELNPQVSLNFFWPQLERQVKIQGIAEKQSPEESDLYFNSRPRSSKIGAWTSPQSEVVESRKTLDDLYKEVEKKFEGKEIPRPEFWGGYIVNPTNIEFWQGRPSRLHDRIRYTFLPGGTYKMERLAP